MTKRPSAGLAASFQSAETLKLAAAELRRAGYAHLDALTPYPVEGLDTALGLAPNRVALLTLLGGLTGAATGFFMQYYATSIDIPLNIAGKPLFSWPAFIPVTFELMVLFAALTAVISMIALNRLPNLHHPVFATPGIERATLDRFFLCVSATDPRFHHDRTSALLLSLGAEDIQEVPG